MRRGQKVESSEFAGRVDMIERVEEGTIGVRVDSEEFDLNNHKKKKGLLLREVGRNKFSFEHVGLEMSLRCLGRDIYLCS